MLETQSASANEAFLQGDIIRLIDQQEEPLVPPYGIIINADCDIAHCKVDGVLSFAAVSKARKMSGGRRVAVLCVSERLFDEYASIVDKRYEGRVIKVDSREPVLDLRHAGKKVIFSMPEYVAGLQFEAVFLIHVDAEDAPVEMGVGESRRFISSVYLGASRAERELRIASCDSRGGPASVLNLALDRGTLFAPK